MEQEFNSLDAQRAAWEAYVLSQAGEGWVLLPGAYDDGGFSGGNMERPALKRLLAQIDAGRVDVLVVYKVDRLTRSLPDFARIVERFDAKGVSFVSVTQAFNTTSSMGRLTLNVLLSFAQFERDVTGERIRDKIAASKARGMWMGGHPPLGYDHRDRHLYVNEPEAALVRQMFERYLELGSVPRLVEELDRAEIRSKAWVSAAGKSMGGLRLRAGAICHILKNRVYLGEIVHKGTAHPGDHDPIISPHLFEAVQRRLEANSVERKRGKVRTASCWLTGKIRDISGQPMRPSFGYGRGGRRYRYYISEGELPGTRASTNAPVTRVSAQHVERVIAERLAVLTGASEHDHEALLPIILTVEIASRNIHVLIDAKKVCEPAELPQQTIDRIAAGLLEGDRIVNESEAVLRLAIDIPPVRRGKTFPTARFDAGSTVTTHQSLSSAEQLRRAHRRLSELNASPLDPDSHKAADAPGEGWTRGGLLAAFLAPDIQKALLKGELLLSDSLTTVSLPLAWEDQRCIARPSC